MNCRRLIKKDGTIIKDVIARESKEFSGCTSLTSIAIPESVTSIGLNAFFGCTDLEFVTIPDSVKYIGGYAFHGTKWLDQQREQNGPLVVVNNILIDGKAAEGGVSIPKDVTSIGDYAFRDCKKLISVTIPDSVTYIGYDAFEGCRNLTSASIPNSVTSIRSLTFNCCTRLTLVNIPKSVESIGFRAFANCTSLTSVTIPDSVTSIEAGTFNGCTSLTSVTIPKSVISIGNNAFEGCNSLENVFYFKEKTYSNVTFPAEVARIAYKVNDEQDELDTKTQVTLVSTSKDVTIKCNAMGEGYEITENSTTSAPEKVTIAHDWDDGTVTTEPTCTAEGSKEFKCTVCNATKEETIEAGHTFSEEWSSNDKEHWHACECGAERDKEGHKSKWEHNSAKHWKVCEVCKDETERGLHQTFKEEIFAPTEVKLGGTKCTCKDCGYVYWKRLQEGGNMATQTLMPDGEEIYLYCARNGLMVKAEVDVGGGKKLTVFLLDPLRVLKGNDSDVLGISVTYVEKGLARYDELMSLLDGDYPIEHINFFEVHPTINGKTKEGSIDSVYMMYEIPEGWDESDIEMILVRDGDDQEFDEKVLEINGKKYLVMWKNHFSPYAMIDKLTDEERAALVVKTGDNSKSVVLMFTAMLITSGLFLEICIKRKRFCYTILTD